jgi:uncharacterized protein (DUF488 family)
MTIFTIGYGNRPITDFLNLLRHYGIDTLVDTRSLPYSRFQPAYRQKAFRAHLESVGIDYVYLGEPLGGKKVDPDCLLPDGAVDLDCLYAKPAFQQALAQVMDLERQGRTPALMCAELRPENCHRYWMLSPPLVQAGFEVVHINASGGV